MYQRLSHTIVTPPPLSEKQTEKCINVFSLSNVQHLDFINTNFFSHKQNLKAIIFIFSSSNHELSDSLMIWIPENKYIKLQGLMESAAIA